ncbi:Fc receptor-like protein 6 [Gracilinanus agilis]|uniref:Fc receptor-like protein 6 n=1 Tax=Gracilinanus agilis TaxID=191870 RepID=UPI001CFEE480|nr:Fc receptor-like protein 6 [Gracilinanus agilis]
MGGAWPALHVPACFALKPEASAARAQASATDNRSNQWMRGRKAARTNHNGEDGDWLILQVPYSVFEGDAVILQCQGWNNAKLSQVTFHKERKLINFTKENNSLPIKAARIEHSGLYSCSGNVNHQKKKQSSKPVILQVQELFPQPELRIKNSTETMEGSPMALSCETQLPLQRSSSQLYFSFFKDNKTIRDRDQSPEYCIPGTIIEDAGLYWCEATTEDGQVQKQSLGLEIQVPRRRRNSQLVLGITLTLLGVTGISTALLLCFRFMKKSEGTAASDSARGPFFPGIPEAPKASLSQDLKSCPVYFNVSHQEEESGDVIYSVVLPRKLRKKTFSNDPSPGEEDISVIYSKVVLPQSQRLSPG